MSNNREVELQFPLSGIDVTAEFQEQKPGTTPEAVNVRGFDAIARRERGGSRPGIAHYAPDPVPADTSLDMTIQHLAVIVDPHASALPQNFETPDDDWVEDPLNPGTFVPPGGWAPPGGAPAAEEEEIAFVQAKGAQADASGPIQVSITFDAAPTIDNDVLLFVGTISNVAGCEVAVVNNVSAALTQVGGYFDQEQIAASNIFTAISLWRIRATAVGNVTLKVTPTKAVAFVSMGALEYSEILNPLPLDDTEGTIDPNLSPADMRVESLSITANGDMAIAGFCNALDPTAGWTVGAGQNDRLNIAYSGNGPALRITDKLPVATPDSPLTLTGTVDGGDTPYVAIGATFKSA